MGKIINLNEYRRKKMIKNMSQITFADIDPLYDFINQIKHNEDFIEGIILKEPNKPEANIENLFSDFKRSEYEDEY